MGCNGAVCFYAPPNELTVHDAPLTALGREQSAALYDATKDTIQKSADVLVTSALRRPLSTALIGYADLRKRLEAEGKPVVVLPQLQEVSLQDLVAISQYLTFNSRSAAICRATLAQYVSAMHYGFAMFTSHQSREVLEADPEYAGLDFSTLTPDWTSKHGFYAPTVPALQNRARWNRRWLRSRPEREIVVVAHGDILRYMTDGHNSYAPWGNAEVREYTFEKEEGEDAQGEAWLVPVKEVTKKGAAEPTTSDLVDGVV